MNAAGVINAIAESALRPAFDVVTGLLLANSPISQTGAGLGPVGDPGAPNAPRLGPAPLSTTDSGGKIVYLVAIAALLGLLAFTVWREFRLALNPRLR